ncbi:NADH:flavin oxidoreductase [Paenibacillus aurantius]|uniref:NADH:flavin oxidoreductase n=1 Tax=Paenibacillus aurantius TaxID=2918900 RepID=A0AA96RFG3_9BACL|nr:NADH:flavin oxidoreductase [Paenibacillus aurantius]WNQ11967.1 NADH:flavin oxidoreductase [Paenibacillus aurantius]
MSNQPKTNQAEALFQPFSIGPLQLANRLVMAPMTRGFSPQGVPGEDVAAYYARRARHGTGLIITEGTLINDPAAGSGATLPSFYGEAALAGWRNVARAVHEAGGRIMPQLWHVGMARKAGDSPNPEEPPVGPSGLSLDGEQVTEPLSTARIEALIEAYGQAAADAKAAGFDGIELHGAHGYLIDQFFWEKTNRRTDEYGGDLVKRTRFAVEAIKAARRAVGPDFPIGFRFSQWKMSDYEAKLVNTPAELEAFLTPLTEAGVDLFHASTRRYWEPEFEGSSLNLAGWTKKITGKPVITVGSVGLDAEFTGARTADTSGIGGLVDRLEAGEFDLVAIGRVLISDPEWPEKIRRGETDRLLPYRAEDLGRLV